MSLSSGQAYQELITNYVIVGGLSVVIWDNLTHLSSEYRLVTQYRIKLPTIVYFISRWSTLLYAVTFTVVQTATFVDCGMMMSVACVAYHTALTSTAFLFFLRVRAIFNKNIYVTIGFLILWAAVLGGSFLALTSAFKGEFGTKYCIFIDLKSHHTIANAILAVFDTCIFVAITFRISSGHISALKNSGPAIGRRFDLVGKYLPAFSKGLLRDGQKYYMVAMITNLLILALVFTPSVPKVFLIGFTVPAAGLTNIVACHVFRHTKMAHNSEDVRAVSTIVFHHSDCGDCTQPDASSLVINFIDRSKPCVEVEAQLGDSRTLTGIQTRGHISVGRSVASSVV